MNINKFLLSIVLILSFNTIFGESVTFTSDEPVTIEMNAWAVSRIFGGPMSLKNSSINGIMVTVPTSLSISKTGCTVDLTKIVSGIRFESLKLITQSGQQFELIPQTESAKKTIIDLPRTLHFRKNIDGTFSLEVNNLENKPQN